MQKQPLRVHTFAFVVGVAILAFGGFASADPPSRVARLGYTTGPVSFSPAGEYDWVQATVNRPLTTGDRLWADARARAEIQVGGAMIRMNADTGVSVLNLDDQIAQLQLTQGTLNVRVRRLEPGQVFEVDTPNLAFTLREPGEYRIEVDPDGNATTIVVRRGRGEVYGEGAAYVIDSRQPYRFTGTDLREYQYVDAPRQDEFDRWASARDRSYDNSTSARYVSQDVIGYQDLDANGTWRVDANYGNVWVPNRVAAGWAPYRDGHWAWVDPWGWTWVDDAPWGFAVSHYGRWTNFGGTWGWVPGPVRTRAYYAPALVAFVGGNNFQLTIGSGNVGGVAWFPLGPREVYRPSYTVSRGYFENVNRSNTVINNTVINNYYNNTNVTNVVYVNQQVPGAIVAVPTTAFVQSQPVARAAVRVTRDMVVSAPVGAIALVAPTEKSVRGAAGKGDKPPPLVFERSAVARTAPPAASVGFAAQQQQLTVKPGRPLDADARKELKREAAAPAPVVTVVAPAQVAQPTALPPPAASGGPGPRDARGKPEKPDKGEQRGQAAAAPQGATPALATPPQAVALPAPVAQPLEQRGKPDKSGRADPRGQPVTPPQAVALPAPMTQPLEQGGKPDKSGRADPRGQPVTPPQAVALPAPMTQPLEQGGKPDKSGRADPRGQPVTPPQAVALPAPMTQPLEQGGKPDKSGRADPRGQPVTSPLAPPQAVAPAPATPPQAVALPAPVTQPLEQRGKPDKSGRADPRGQPVALPPVPPQAVAPAAPPQAAAPALVAPPQAAVPPAPTAQLRDQKQKPAADKPKDKNKGDDEQTDKQKKDRDGQKPEEKDRKPKG